MFFKNNKTENTKNIENKIDNLIEIITKEHQRRDKWEAHKESLLFETMDAKGKLETEKAKLLEDKIILKDTINIKEKLVEDLTSQNTSYKKTIKDLSLEINSFVKYKNENDNLKKQLKKLEKEVEDYKEKGISVPKKVSGSTKPRKGQALKETVRTVKN